jgi:hypothetical protein
MPVSAGRPGGPHEGRVPAATRPRRPAPTVIRREARARQAHRADPVLRIQQSGTRPPGLAAGLAERANLVSEVRRLAAADPGVTAADVTAGLGGEHPFEALVAAVNEQVRSLLQQPADERQAARIRAATHVLALVKHHALVRDVLRAVARHETGERAIESNMRTSAGVRASLASQVQATIPWTITALLQLDEDTLRDRFSLTRAELLVAQNRGVRARQLWDAVHASPAGTTAAQLLADPTNQAHLGASGLTQGEVATMLEFRELRLETQAEQATRRAALEALTHQQLFDRATPADRSSAGVTTVAALADAARRGRLVSRAAAREAAHQVAATSARPGALGIRETDLFAYARGNWAEDRAAWIRLAVSRDPAGPRIEAAATADEGRELGRARISRLVRDFTQANPDASDEDVCRHVASRHNPGAGNPYVDAVLGHFRAIRAAP